MTRYPEDNTRDSMLERALPHAAEAERAVLGSIILDNALVNDAVELLTPEDFYTRAHQSVFRAMTALCERGSEINPILLGEELRREGALEQTGGITYVSELTYGLPHRTNLAAYAKLILDKAKKRELIKACQKTTSACLEDEDDSAAVLDDHSRMVFALADGAGAGTSDRLGRLVKGVLAETAERAERGAAAVTGVATGLRDVDTLLLGLQPEDLIILAARPGMGKSALALGAAVHAAVVERRRVAFFSLEMSRRALAMRAACAEAHVDTYKMRSGYLGPDEWERLTEAYRRVEDAPLCIDDQPGINTLQLRAKARRIARELGGLDLIVVDYVQLFGNVKPQRGTSREQEVSAVSRDLKAVAKEFCVPVLALSQMNRASEGRSDHRPQLSDLRESGGLEQDADVVCFIFREEQYKRTEENAGTADFIVAKHRNGACGTVRLTWLAEFTKFEDMWRG
jgi:replicative DNA helicase